MSETEEQDETTGGGRNVRSSDLLGGLLPIGTRIRFTKTLTSPADEVSPGNLYAREGDGGEITGHGTPEGYWVKWDNWPHAFGASRDEFEPVTPNAKLTGDPPQAERPVQRTVGRQP